MSAQNTVTAQGSGHPINVQRDANGALALSSGSAIRTNNNSPVFQTSGGAAINTSGKQNTVSILDGGAVAAAIASTEAAARMVAEQARQMGNMAASIASAQGETASAALSANQLLAENEQTGGAATQNKTLLYVGGLAVVALLGWLYLKK